MLISVHGRRYNAVLQPITSFICELMDESCRESTRTEICFEDLEKVRRCCIHNLVS